MAFTQLLSSSQFSNDIATFLSNHCNTYTSSLDYRSSSWQATEYTGSGIVSTLANQVSLYDDNKSGSGSTTIQIQNGKVGWFLNGFSTQTYSDAPQWSFTLWNKNLPSGVKPWSHGQNLHMYVNQLVNWCAMWGNACIFTYFGMFVKCGITGKVFAVIYNTWDSRNGYMPPAGASHSVEPTELLPEGSIPFGHAPIVSGSNYITNFGSDFQSGSAAPKIDAYHGVITPQQFNNMIALVRNLQGFNGISPNSWDYEILGVDYHAEIVPDGPKVDRITGNCGITINGIEINSQ
ncbi:hypothetical protein M2375_001035 [Comamonas sp. BIGb0152]|uniref:hypothetical protein n=1 Tax=Comamonas sp. BIGb0152 TaxID=2940601 RepID=UPI0021699F06|nr:hypothetical protein [Comamonas sp. BIGb0152]MCS4292829.1 hypothetical protein [Comamonas sp. BIGb0152]